MSRVPPLTRQHEWVLIGNFQIDLDGSETRRILEAPDDIAVSWRQRGELTHVTGPGCRVCGGHASEVMGKPCPGGTELEQAVKAREVREGIWTPQTDG